MLRLMPLGADTGSASACPHTALEVAKTLQFDTKISSDAQFNRFVAGTLALGVCRAEQQFVLGGTRSRRWGCS
jgi:hypothetical protein